MSDLDGELKHDAQLKEKYSPTIFATSGIREGDGVLILKVVNPFEEEKTCRVLINGTSAVESNGEAIVLTSGSPADENSLEEPERVVPKLVSLRGLGKDFEYHCPPNSVPIVKAKIRRYDGFNILLVRRRAVIGPAIGTITFCSTAPFRPTGPAQRLLSPLQLPRWQAVARCQGWSISTSSGVVAPVDASHQIPGMRQYLTSPANSR